MGVTSESVASTPPKKGCHCGLWILGSILLAVLVGFLVPTFCGVQEHARAQQAFNNCRQILIALKSYAADHDGRYPDARLPSSATSNEVFRELVKLKLLEDERVFGAPASFAMADNDIGEPPHFESALVEGENHWCIVTGLTDHRDGNRALLFENPVDDETWPPVWNADMAGKPVPGRSWKQSGKIIAGRNDGSVSAEKLSSKHGSRVPLHREANALLFPPGGDFLPVAK